MTDGANTPDLTVVIARPDPEVSAEACARSIGGLGRTVVVDAPAAEDDARVHRRARAWLDPIDDWHAWAIAGAPPQPGTWLLLVHVDERVPAELAEEIRRTLADSPAANAFRIPRRRLFLGRPLASRRETALGAPRLVRAPVAPEPSDVSRADAHDAGVGVLTHSLDHDPHADLESCMSRLEREATREARRMAGRGERARARDVVLGPVVAFLDGIILRGGVRDGTVGLVLAAVEGAFRLVCAAKLWELEMPERLRRVPSLPEPPP